MYASHSWKLIKAWTLVVAMSFPLLIANQKARAVDSSEMSNHRALTQPGSPALPQSGSLPPPTEQDCRLAVFAREALLQDSILGPLNLGVSVHSGTATLWGTVPTVALARQAEEKIRRVPGVAQVKNDLRIIAMDDPSMEFLGEPRCVSTRVLTDLGSPLAERRPQRKVPLVSQESSSRSGRVSAMAPLIMPPIPVPAGPTRTVSAFEPTAAPSPVSPPSSLVETLEKLRRSNECFNSIRFQLQGSWVRLWSNKANVQDVFFFAQQVSHLPGVERVIVEGGQ